MVIYRIFCFLYIIFKDDGPYHPQAEALSVTLRPQASKFLHPQSDQRS
ncbi:hypothetical protein GEPA3_3605 [Geobacillus sp. PA-3]|nr:hypothetical protein GEPA3_3605 [Geobacillus sp. PA-3]